MNLNLNNIFILLGGVCILEVDIFGVQVFCWLVCQPDCGQSVDWSVGQTVPLIKVFSPLKIIKQFIVCFLVKEIVTLNKLVKL